MKIGPIDENSISGEECHQVGMTEFFKKHYFGNPNKIIGSGKDYCC